MGIMEKMRLDGKRSFVTGGARGIGKAIATALAEAGSDVALLDVDIATAQQTAAEIAQATGRVIRAYEVDVTQEAQVDAVVQQLIEGRYRGVFPYNDGNQRHPCFHDNSS